MLADDVCAVGGTIMGPSFFVAVVVVIDRYCQWAHVLSGFCQEYPGVQAAIDDKVRGFISSERGRNKCVPACLRACAPARLRACVSAWCGAMS